MEKVSTKKHTHFAETFDGITLIRAFGKQNDFKKKINELNNNWITCQVFQDACHFYFQVRLFFLSNIMFLCSGFLCIHLRGTMAPIYLAMMFNYLEGMNNRLCSLLHGGKEIRENLIAVQKLLKLDDVKQELPVSPEGAEEVEVPAEWPSVGAVSFKNVSLRYRPETDLVLNDLSFDV